MRVPDECPGALAAHPHALACELGPRHEGPHRRDGRTWTDAESADLDGALRRAEEDARWTARQVVLGAMTPRAAAFRALGAGGTNRREMRALARGRRR